MCHALHVAKLFRSGKRKIEWAAADFEWANAQQSWAQITIANDATLRARVFCLIATAALATMHAAIRKT
jgi:hypothetical protein